MPNMSLKKNEMPVQAPDVRNKNFSRGCARLHRGAGHRRGATAASTASISPAWAAARLRSISRPLLKRSKEEDFEGAYEIIDEVELAPGGLRARMSAGDAVREQVCARHQGRAGGNRPSGAVCRGLAHGARKGRSGKGRSQTGTRSRLSALARRG